MNVPATATGVVAIAAGGYHNLALRSDGTVIAWGSNGNGQTNVPATATGVVAIAGGFYHSLALRGDGTVIAWGAGQTFGALPNYGQSIVPANATGVVAIASGAYHSLALRGDGTVIVWGDNSFGLTNVPASATGVVAIAGGYGCSLALRGDGTVIAWGNNVNGQTNVPAAATGVVAIAAGGFHNLALRSDGVLIAWGAGTNNTGVNPSLGQANVPASATGVVAIAGGLYHSLALRADRVPAQVALLDRNNTFAGTVSASSFAGNGAGLTNLGAVSLAPALATNLATLNGANQTFTGPVSFSSTSNTFTGTFSGDGLGITNADIGELSSGALTWGTFVLKSSPGVGYHPRSVAAADVNGDGKVDLINANYFENTLSVLTNNGSGGFTLASSPGVGSYPISVAVADVNGDGKVDLINANYGGGTLSVLTNNGSGGFSLASSPGAGTTPQSVAAADVNGDGKVDLISADYSSSKLSVLMNNGSGGFSLASSPGVGPTPASVATADVNGDGRVDLVSANYNADTLSILFNTPVFAGSFAGDGSGLTGITGASLANGTISNAHLSASVLTNISARLASNVWAAADSTTNYTRRTGDTNSGPLTIGTRTGVTDLQTVSLRVVGSNNVNWKGAAAFGHTNTAVIVGELTGVATVGGHNAALSTWSALALNPGGGNVGIGTLTPTGLLHVAGNAYANAWLTTSDRNAKQDIAPVDAAAILEKISALPVASWSFKTEPDVKHIGPMAQDFRAAFGLGPNDTSIATVDADGVALAAIQALNAKLERENAELKKQLDEVLQRLKALEAR